MLVEGLQEQNRLKIMDEVKRSIEVDNHEAVKIGDVEKKLEAIRVVGPDFNKEDSHRQRSGKLWTNSHFEKKKACCAFSSTQPMWERDGDHRWWTRAGMPSVKPSTEAVEGAEWEKSYCKVVEMNTAVNNRHPSGNHRAESCGK